MVHSSFVLQLLLQFLLVVKGFGEKGLPASYFYDAHGRLPQVESADKASKRGSTVIAVHNRNHGIILTYKSSGDDNDDDDDANNNEGEEEEENEEKHKQDATSMRVPRDRRVHILSSSLGAAFTGIASDVHFLANKLFDEVSLHTFVFGTDMPNARLANELADTIHSRTLAKRFRPLGVRACLMGCDTQKNVTLFEIDALGSCVQRRLACVGKYGEALSKRWGRGGGKTVSTREKNVFEIGGSSSSSSSGSSIKRERVDSLQVEELVEESIEVIRRYLNERKRKRQRHINEGKINIDQEEEEHEDNVDEEEESEKKVAGKEQQQQKQKRLVNMRGQDMSIAIVGRNCPFCLIDPQAVEQAVERGEYGLLKEAIRKATASSAPLNDDDEEEKPKTAAPM